MRPIKLILFLHLILALAACDPFAQRHVKFSAHDFSEGDVLSQSYPSELRALTLIRQYNTASAEKLTEAGNLLGCIEQLKAAQNAFKQKRPVQSALCGGSIKSASRSVDDALKEKVQAWSELMPAISKVYVLAEPPPDSVITAKQAKFVLPLSVPAVGGITVETPEQVLNRYARSNESDVKRYLAYRLNEALINFPDRIGPHYTEIMLAIIQQRVEQPSDSLKQQKPDDASGKDVKTDAKTDAKKSVKKFAAALPSKLDLLKKDKSPKAVQEVTSSSTPK